MNHTALAQAIINLINSKPRSPTVDEIAAVLNQSASPLLTTAAIQFAERAYPAIVAGRSPAEVFLPITDFRINEIFDAFHQTVGPPMAYNECLSEDLMPERLTYQVFAWQSRDLDRIVARVRDLATQIKAYGGHTIVWRTKPEIAKDADGLLRFYSRFHILPYVTLPGAKPECERMQDA